MDEHGLAKRLVVASRNAGKVVEIRQLLAGYAVKVTGLNDLSDSSAPSEPYDTFADNARHKALQLTERTGMAALADDSGLQVDALGGRPGVYSSRYGSDDRQRIEKLLAELADVPDERRGACFVCVIAIAYQGQVVGVWEGECQGVILREPRGNRGFGYDPIFYYPPLHCTFAEMSTEQKNEVSHRGRALQAMLEALRGGHLLGRLLR